MQNAHKSKGSTRDGNHGGGGIRMSSHLPLTRLEENILLYKKGILI